MLIYFEQYTSILFSHDSQLSKLNKEKKMLIYFEQYTSILYLTEYTGIIFPWFTTVRVEYRNKIFLLYL